MENIIIVGGGAAGFFCASNLDEGRYRVTILEQNAEVLQKVKISGGGRCNVSHACFDPAELVGFYPRGYRELRSVFSKFQPADTMTWLKERGVALKIEEDQRIFPESNSSQTIIDVFLREVAYKGFEIRTKTSVRSIERQGEQYLVKTNNGNFNANFVIYTTGSSPKSLKIVESLGHTLVPAVPSLFTFNIQEALLEGVHGTSFPNASVKIPALKTEEQGALLITHWGLSGPVILKLSAWEARNLAACGYTFDVEVNFISQSLEQAEKQLLTFKSQFPKKSIGQSKIYEVTQRFWNKILEVSQVNPAKQMAQISSKEKQLILQNLCKKLMKVEGKSTFKEEFVTAGGVNLKEIDFKTMASKKIPNFYIAGEVLDIDAVTGGFNFQACWSEAWLIAEALNKA